MKKPTRLLFYLFSILFYFLGLAVFLFVFSPSKQSSSVLPEVLDILPNELVNLPDEPPALALKGETQAVVPTVSKLVRNRNEWEEVKDKTIVLMGESLKTDKTGKSRVIFNDHLTVEIEPNSEIKFINLLPDSFLISQLQGKVNYQVNKPTSFRIGLALLLILSGQLKIESSLDNQLFTVNLLSGSGQFALIDKDNQTQVYLLKAGQRLFYQKQNQSVNIK